MKPTSVCLKRAFSSRPLTSASSYDVVIAGTGVVALATARYLRRLDHSIRVALISPHAPMTYTSSMSTECFRDHWPSPVMRSFMRRSICLLQNAAERTGGFSVHKPGYLYISRGSTAAAAFAKEALTVHGSSGFTSRSSSSAAAAPSANNSNATVYTDGDALRRDYAFLAPELQAGLRAHNAGWVSAHTMGISMLEEASATSSSSSKGCVDVIRGAVTGFDVAGGRIAAVRYQPGAWGATGADGHTLPDAAAAAASSQDKAAALSLSCRAFVNACGPFLNSVHIAMCEALEGGSSSSNSAGSATSADAAAGQHQGLSLTAKAKALSRLAALRPPSASYAPSSPHALPLVPEVHAKVVFRDTLRAIPRDAPMTICNDAIELPWSGEEAAAIRDSLPPQLAQRLLSPLPAGAHFRPYGGPGSDVVLMLWERWHEGVHAPSEPPPVDVSPLLDHEWYPDVCIRGMSTFVPALRQYFDGSAASASAEKADAAAAARRTAVVDGGYYMRTRENIPLIGPAPGPYGEGSVEGAFLAGGVSGFGIMAAHAAGELAALHVTGSVPRDAMQVKRDHLARCTDSLATISAPESDGVAASSSYAAIMSPLRYQQDDYVGFGGLREQLMAAGGGQL